MVAPLELKQMESRRRSLGVFFIWQEPLQGKWAMMPAFFPRKLRNIMVQPCSILISSCRQPACVFNAMCCEVSVTSPAEACCGVSFSSPWHSNVNRLQGSCPACLCPSTLGSKWVEGSTWGFGRHQPGEARTSCHWDMGWIKDLFQSRGLGRSTSERSENSCWCFNGYSML